MAVQPYIKNWGVFVHPLGPGLPSDPALAAWHQGLYYGSMARSQVSGFPYYEATTAIGSFDRRVCGSVPCRYQGIMGQGCDPVGGCGYWPGPGAVATPSLTQTSLSSPAEELMVTEGAQWDLWTSYIGLHNPLTYGVYWLPADLYAANGSSYSMAGPNARKNPKPQFDPTGISNAKCTPADLCDGYINFGIVHGTTTIAAADGHAKAMDYRGGLMAQGTLGDGTKVIKALWPDGGY